MGEALVKVDVATGLSTAIAGLGRALASASIDRPTGVAFDAARNVTYLSESLPGAEQFLRWTWRREIA